MMAVHHHMYARDVHVAGWALGQGAQHLTHTPNYSFLGTISNDIIPTFGMFAHIPFPPFESRQVSKEIDTVQAALS